MSLSRTLRHLGAGRLLYQLWHAPLAPLRESLAAGGPWQQRRDARGRADMEAAARDLGPPPPAVGAPLVLHLLTGRRFWYQAAFCLWTFAHHAGRPLAPVLYDDGTFESAHRDVIARLFPAARFRRYDESIARLDAFLPASRFPALRERWLNYPNIRKLIDPHLGASGWKLVIDSDLLFFRRPDALLRWLDSPDTPLHAVDCETSYGYSRALMTELGGTPAADLVNVGLTGLESASLDWDRLEYWCRTLIARERTHYYLEQALVAMLVAGRACTILPACDYVTGPRPPEAHACRAVMHHYVAGSKRWYFRKNWRRALTVPPGAGRPSPS